MVVFFDGPQCVWTGLALDVMTCTLAVVARLANGRLGYLAVPVWLVSLPSALHFFSVLMWPGPVGMSPPWFLLIAPLIVFYCCSWAYERPRFWVEDILVGTMLANLQIAMWCALLEAASI